MKTTTWKAAVALALIAMGFAGELQAQDNAPSNPGAEAYRIYDSSGNALGFESFSELVLQHQVVLFGEFHNDPIVHWLQRLLVVRALEDSVKTALGLEMLERDDQVIWNEYLAGYFNYNRLESEAKLWTNHKTDYHPIIEVAHEGGMEILATNAPRRYATMAVSHSYQRIDSIDGAGGDLLPPLPVPIPPSDSGYAAMQKVAGPHGGMSDGMIRAQALKDYCMAHSIREALLRTERVIHLNGDFHSRFRDGIGSFLEQLDESIDFVVVTVVYSDEPLLPLTQEAAELGDFLVVLPSSMTKTH